MTKRPILLLAAAVMVAGSCTGDLQGGGQSEEPTDPSDRGSPAQRPPNSGSNPSPPASPPLSPVPTMPAPYEPLPPPVYAAKAKDLLTGLGLEDAELEAVAADPEALKGLIDKWMELPQFRDKMLDFFKRAFQQTQLDASDLEDMLGVNGSGISAQDQQRILRSVEESFARTVLALIDEGRPFTETVTTSRFMLNVPLMAALAYMDAAPENDLGRPVAAGFWHLTKFGGAANFKFVMTTNVDPTTGMAMPIPFEETIDPAHPNFMKWTFTQPPPERYMPCADPITVTGTTAIRNVFRALFGGRRSCQGAPPSPSVFTDSDWTTWRMVTVRQPKEAEERTTFWEVPKLRDPKTTELVLATPRVGFMTTLAFFANWPTNPSNSYRVTLNQALIVGLNRSFDDRGTTVQVAETSVDSMHVEPNSICFGCHQTLDPMRDFFQQTYSITYFQQLRTLDKRNPPLPAEGVFAVDGAPAVRGFGVEALANAIAGHPRFATAWTQKLCEAANASPCLEDDPEFLRVANAFKNKEFDFKTLVRELYSSPLVTFATKTKTAAENGVIMSIARRETFCARLSHRLGIADVCSREGASGLPRVAALIKNLSLGIPGSGYSRADERPVMPHDPNLFFSSGTEKICMTVALQLIDAGTTPRWKSSAAESAIADFVSIVMGVPPRDGRAGALRDILTRHYAAAVATEKPAEALRSAFTLACSSPLAVSSGL